MKTKNKMTQIELIGFMQGLIDKNYNGNKSEAARDWGSSPTELFEILSMRRRPSKAILGAIGFRKCEVIHYLRCEK